MVLKQLARISVVICLAVACDAPSAFERNRQAHLLAARLQAEFQRSIEASHSIAVAPPDDAQLLHEVETATAAVERDASALETTLRSLHYAHEAKLVAEFRAKYAAYRVLERERQEKLQTNAIAHAAQTPSMEERTIMDGCTEALDELLEAISARSRGPRRS